MPLSPRLRPALLFVPVLAVLGFASFVVFGALENDAQAEQDRQLHFMKTAAFEVVDDVGYELFNLVSAFSFDLNTLVEEGDHVDRQALTNAVRRYRKQARFPALFRDLVCLEMGTDGRFHYVSWSDKGWIDDDQPSWAQMLRMPARDAGKPPARVADTFSLDRPVMAVYLRNRKPALGEVVAVALRFSSQVVIEQVVPALAASRFADNGDTAPYRARIVNQKRFPPAAEDAADWEVALVPWTPFEGWFDYYANRVRTLERSRAAFEQFTPRPLSVEAAGTGWSLAVSRLPAGLNAERDWARVRNLGLSVGFFVVLALGFLGLYLTTRQTKQHERQVRTFLALISHELKTPLAVVQSLADNLTRGIGTDEARAREYGLVLREEADRLGRMVSNILGLTAIQGGVSPKDRQPVDLTAVVRERLSRQDRGTVEVELVERLAEGLPSVWGHPAALAAAVDNLIGNAFRHGVAGGGGHRVEVELRAERRRVAGVLLVVQDNGPGFSWSEGRTFRRPFRRGLRAQANQTPGTGVGLSLVHRTAESLGGSLRWHSKPGHGARFELWLRAVQ